MFPNLNRVPPRRTARVTFAVDLCATVWLVLAFVGLGVGLGSLVAFGAAVPPAPANFAREKRVVAGWTLHLSQELLAQEPKATARSLELLQKQLEEIVRVVPPQSVAELQKVPLYFSPEYPGVKPRAEFHPGAGWLRDNGRDPAMAKGVEFTNIRLFEREMNRMPNFALHELAHAYHDRVLPQGFGNPEIRGAYERAKAGGKYERVERWHGNGQPNTFERAYAMTNPQEFFAENTEAFFSRNDYFPFTRDELKQFDPETFALLEKLWAPRLEKDNPPKDAVGKASPEPAGVSSLSPRKAGGEGRGEGVPRFMAGEQVLKEQGAAYEPTWESVNRHNPGGTAPEWIKDGKFGIYFHWGAYSVPAFQATSFGEWYPKTMNTPGKGENQHHKEIYGDPSEWPYHFFINGARDKAGRWVRFEPKLKSAGGRFDPEEWAQLFLEAGAKFAGPCAEHHDGYSMWRSKQNEWNTGDKIGLDIVGLITAAVRQRGLKVVTSFHHAFPIVWGWYPTNDPSYWPAKCTALGDVSLQKLYGKLPLEQGYQLWQDKLAEVIDAYQPDFIWHDVGIIAIPEKYRLNHLAYYYNRAAAWGREVMVSFKNEELNRDCAVLDFEGGATDDIACFSWVCDQNLGPESWGYVEGMKYYPAKTVLHSLLTIVSKNGSLLLNLSQKADGTIPQEQKEIALSLGRWLGRFGECVYGTRPWATYGEGPAHGADGVKECTAQDIRFTRNKAGTALYAIVCGWPGDGASLNISSLKRSHLDLSTLARVELLGDKPGSYATLGWKQDDDGLKVALPATRPYAADTYPIKLSFSGPMPSTPVLTRPPLFSTGGRKPGGDVRLREGEYTTAQLQAAGIQDKAIVSLKVNAGWTVVLFEDDHFRGKSVTCSTMVRELSCAEFRFARKTSSLKVIKTKTALNLQ